ncbi:hypothetical protein SIAM614_24497 [Stappia aggregata IAM 12614]|uniref:Uncharacterized protein n=1 Tax=Roseibium aggregatum (strain ATCC 25650 / DSM 13394 / JCM 20685 / NBRC 16684 / NCIMB 2208 / IAM 12614 / B1) TaxID=384765 RepID=A0NNV6_ROSAI|nr:hypothetical protein SIAM614_24497 [Stappia aggregata IAM 12614] [Roseibium aggregatum IAM 12614]
MMIRFKKYNLQNMKQALTSQDFMSNLVLQFQTMM